MIIRQAEQVSVPRGRLLLPHGLSQARARQPLGGKSCGEAPGIITWGPQAVRRYGSLGWRVRDTMLGSCLFLPLLGAEPLLLQHISCGSPLGIASHSSYESVFFTLVLRREEGSRRGYSEGASEKPGLCPYSVCMGANCSVLLAFSR